MNNKSYELYHFTACPFCIKVRLALWWMKISIPLKNIATSNDNFNALLGGGGKQQVPCLHITNEDGQSQWLYESDAIIRYFRKA